MWIGVNCVAIEATIHGGFLLAESGRQQRLRNDCVGYAVTLPIMKNTCLTLFVASFVLLFASSQFTVAQDENWSRFRGNNGVGVSEARIPANWTKDSYRWQIDLPGTGHGSPAVWGNRIFLNAADVKGRQRLFVCIAADSGKILWQRKYKADTHKKHKSNSYATVTPAVDEKHVYTAWDNGGNIILTALAHDGSNAWSSDLGKVKGGHGFGVSPSVVGDLVILPNDQDGSSSLIAVNRDTGKIVWNIPRNSLRLTYSVPCLFEYEGAKPQLIFTNWHHGITGVDHMAGKVLWELDVFGKPDKERAIGSPVIAGDLIIGTCGFVTKKKHVVAIRPAGVNGAKESKEIWRIERSVPHIPTLLVEDERVWLWDDLGVITLLNRRDGEVIYRARIEGVAEKFFASPVYAGGVIFNVSANGKVVAIDAGDVFKQLASNDLKEKAQATPAIANGDMFIRTFSKLVCVKGLTKVN